MHSKEARINQHIFLIRSRILIFLTVNITEPSQIMMQIFGCNTIKTVDPAFQTAMIAVDILNVVNTFYTLFPIGLEALMI